MGVHHSWKSKKQEPGKAKINHRVATEKYFTVRPSSIPIITILRMYGTSQTRASVKDLPGEKILK